MDKSSKLYKYPIGAQFFKYEGNELVLLRLYKIKNENCFLLKDKQKNKVVLNKKQFEDFKMLEPDGLLIHVLASDPMQGIDTVCLLYRMKDINKDINEPYAVCRQNIVDPFETILNNDSSIMYVGASISKDTAPPDFDYKSVCLAAGIKDQRINFIYKEDSLDDILEFINEEMYDKALSIIKTHMSDTDGIKYKGFNETYRGLLEENNFMYDFKRAFDIVQINFAIDTSIDRWTEDGVYKITKKEIMYFESLTKYEMVLPLLIKYDRTIDLDEVKRSYILFEDSTKELYIISYDKGEYVNREYDALEDKRDKEVLEKLIYK